MAAMPPPAPSRAAALSGLEDAVRRYTTLLRGVSDASKTAIGHWSIGHVATHTAHIFELFPELVRGEASPITDHLALSEYWEERLKEDDERDPRSAARRVAEATSSLEAALDDHGWNHNVKWHGGLPVPAYALPLILVNEAEIHGLDVAKAEGRPWHIPRDHAVLAFYGLLTIMPYYLKRDVSSGLTMRFQLRLRGGPVAYLEIDNDELTIDDRPPARIDCKLSVDPVDYLLIGYGRRGRLGPIAKGAVVAYGRKPWLGLKLPNLFHSV